MAKKKPPKVHRADSTVEFRLLIERFEDPLAKRAGVVFLFRTSEEFRNFVYELVVNSRREENKIFFNIVGLRTPMSDFPRPGPAVCICEVENLEPGEYTIVIDRRGKQVNQFKISIKGEIKVLRAAREGRFIDIITDRSQWSSHGEQTKC